MKTAKFLLIIILALPNLLTADSLIISNPMTTLTDSAEMSTGDSSAVIGSSAEAESDFLYPMSAERKEKLISYSKFNNVWRFAGFFIAIAFLLILLLTGLSARFRQWAEALSGRKLIIYSIYILILTLFLFVVNLPFDYYRGFMVEHEYGFSNQTAGQWFGESLKSLALEIVFSLIVISFLYWLINKTRKWWLYFALGSIPFLVFIMLIYPVAISPLFNEFKPVQDKILAEEMTSLAEKAGIHNPDIYEVDGSKQSSKINAYFVGLFGTKRIVLYDTIIKNFSVEELKFVMAHEIGHYLKNHIWYGLFSAVIMIFIICWLINRLLHKIIQRYSQRFGFDSLGNIASLPLIFLFISVFSFITQPVFNGLLRVMEYQSDRFGLELSQVTGEVAATAFDKLSVYNLSDPDPAGIIEFWFYDHPALKKRMANVENIYKEINAIQ